MVKDLVASSPFINLEFIEAGEILNESNLEKLFDYYKIDSGAVSFNLNRDFVDYRITPFFSEEQISELNINHFDLDSLSYFQVSEFLNFHSFSSIKIEKSDIAVYLQLPDNYDSYLKNLSKKNRHELKRKKRIFEEKFDDFSYEQSKDEIIFDEFITLHRNSIGEKGDYMTEDIEKFYKALFEENKWEIHYLKHKDSMIAGAFVYESEKVQYLYNSCRDHNLDEFNTGTYLNDQLLQNSIKKSKQYFDFLKGEEKYKFNFGGEAHQLYDLKIKV